jgi:hypothetical protein
MYFLCEMRNRLNCQGPFFPIVDQIYADEERVKFIPDLKISGDFRL